MGQKGPIVSCYECAAIEACYGNKQPGLAREEARARAAACSLPQKGRVTDVIRIVGRERGMSRKKVQAFVQAGQGEWLDQFLARLDEDVAPGSVSARHA